MNNSWYFHYSVDVWLLLPTIALTFYDGFECRFAWLCFELALEKDRYRLRIPQS